MGSEMCIRDSNVHDGKLTYAAVGEALGLETVKPDLKALSVLH